MFKRFVLPNRNTKNYFMKLSIYFGLIFTLLFTSSQCKQVENDKSGELLKEVFELHDSIMPMSESLAQMSLELKNLDSKNDSLPAGMNAEYILQTKINSDKLYDQMMDWMRDYKDPTNMNATDKINYLTGEKNKLQKMLEETQRAMKESKSILDATK